MLSKVREMFKVPPSPFTLGKPSFVPVNANPIKIPERRLSTSSRDEPVIQNRRLKQIVKYPERNDAGSGSDAEERNVYQEEGGHPRRSSGAGESVHKGHKRKRSNQGTRGGESKIQDPFMNDNIIAESAIDDDGSEQDVVRHSFVMNSQSENSSDPQRTIFTLPRMSHKRKDRSVRAADDHRKSKKHKKVPKPTQEVQFMDESHVLTAAEHAEDASLDVNGDPLTASKDLTKQQRKEERQKRRLEKAERKKRKAERHQMDVSLIREQEIEDSVVVEPIADELVVEEDEDGILSTSRTRGELLSQEIGESSEVTGIPSRQTNPLPEMEIPATQVAPTTEEGSSEQDIEKNEHTRSHSAESLPDHNDNAHLEAEFHEEPEHKLPYPEPPFEDGQPQTAVLSNNAPQIIESVSLSPQKAVRRSPPSKRRVLSNVRILDSDAEDEGIEEVVHQPNHSHSPQKKRRKISDLEKLSTRTRPDRQTDPTNNDENNLTVEESRVKESTSKEDKTIHRIVRQYKKREKVSDGDFIRSLQGRKLPALIADLELQNWKKKSIEEIYNRVQQLYCPQPLKGGRLYNAKEEDIVRQEVNSFLMLRKMTSEQFAHWLSEDVKSHYSVRESRNLCQKIATKLPGRDTLSVTRHILKRYPVESLPSEWTATDDVRLRRLVAEKGKQWKVIAKEMGRSMDMVRLRYKDYVLLGESRTIGEWNMEDMQKLFEIVIGLLQKSEWEEKEGLDVDIIGKYIDWGTVSEKMNNRSRLQCRKKWGKVDFWKHKISGKGLMQMRF